MRRLRGIVTMGAGVLLLAASGALGATSAAAEAALESNGWWYKPNQVPNNLAVPPAPPGVESDGLFVAADPSGPMALAAVRYIAEGAGTLTLKFSPEGNTGTPSIAACVALTAWDGATAGRWEGKPIYDCARQSEGVVSPDGSEMTFQVDPSMQRVAGTYDLVLAPVGPVPFGAAFSAPRDENLVTEGGSGAGSDPEAVASTSEPYAGDPLPAGGADFGPIDTTFPVLDESRGSGAGAAGTAQAPGTTAPRVRAPIVPAVANPLALPDDRNERLAAMAGLGLLLIGAWWFGGQVVRPPRLLGSVAGRAQALEMESEPADAPVRGIGRFSRPRP